MFLKERIREDSQEAISFKDLLNNRINEYVEEVLTPYFGNLMRFVKVLISSIIYIYISIVY
jgi:hypothetical protein